MLCLCHLYIILNCKTFLIAPRIAVYTLFYHQEIIKLKHPRSAYPSTVYSIIC